MLNSIGLANPGMEAVRREQLPWLERNLRRARVWVSVAGHSPDEYPDVVAHLDSGEGFVGFELNLSCPNDTERGGLPFALDGDALAGVVESCRRLTDRPLWVKLAPNDPRLVAHARRAEEAGADGLTLVNTLPGRVLGADGRPVLGAGQGGVSGPALRPVGLQAVTQVRPEVGLPLIGVGGILTAAHARSYLFAGASLVQMGTASFAAPRQPERVARQLMRKGWPRVALRESAGGRSRGRRAGDPRPDEGDPMKLTREVTS
jgi:dihydroorotate dehydrogenase (NAD+) catalytic subunit